MNEVPLVLPGSMKLPAAEVTVRLGRGENSPTLVLETNATALFVTVTARAHGRFSDNFFAMRAGEKRTLKFLSRTLKYSLRVEHLPES